MRRFFFWVSIMLLPILPVGAQSKTGTFSLIPRVGVSITNIHHDELSLFSSSFANTSFSPKYKPGFVAGMDFQYQASDRLAVSLGAFYTRQGDKFKDIEKVSEEGGEKSFSGASDIHTNLDYVNVPVMGHYYVAPGLSVNAGIQVGVLVNGKFHEEVTAYTETTDESGTVSRSYSQDADGNLLKDHAYVTDVKDQYKRVDFSLPVGISYEYMNVVLDARYNIGLTNVSKDSGTQKNQVFLFSVGYKFDL